ncbi:hypothetical protein FBEOM_14431 [Fusarium beomiforme]|uniref:Uncharacterized protein n=1 Tax=Fusarium beomiforme TaxID=44412 RepID=A0A9P5A3L9_9HYPO|nr:hypothetical protein FBEOM_14431 [Fusarium beomiforme]
MREIREVCLKELPEAGQNTEGANSCFALVADEAVLKDIARGIFVIKVVGYDWNEGRASRGWVRIPTGDVLRLWESLLFCDATDSDMYDEIHFEMSEPDLERYIWQGVPSMYTTGDCSEAQTAQLKNRPQRIRFRTELRQQGDQDAHDPTALQREAFV